jgi:hypothetical protein
MDMLIGIEWLLEWRGVTVGDQAEVEETAQRSVFVN